MRYLLMFLTVFSLSVPQLGCAGTKAGRAVADVVLPPSQERQLGEQMSKQVSQEYQMLSNPEITNWVESMGNEVVRAARGQVPGDIKFEFSVIDDEMINAFALPGGWIYVTTGLLQKADNEAEIMAVLAHEVAHVTERHIAQRLAAQYGVSALANVALGQDPGLLQELMAGLVANGYLLRHSREAERDADAVGMNYLVQAGYSPWGYVTFFEKLADEPQPPAILSSHPHPEERITNARREIARMSKATRSKPTGEQDYQSHIASLR